jgi:FkbM family methyltransferase
MNSYANLAAAAKSVARLLPKSFRKIGLNFLQSVIPPRRMPNSYSQCGEDRILSFLYYQLGISKPRYLDVGTWHPSESNNTYLFYQNGARGVCVEPNPSLIPLITQVRPEDKVLNLGIAEPGAGPCDYFSFSDPQLNTFDAEEANARVQSGIYKLENQFPVPTMPLSTVLAEHFPQGLDLLSLDAEGLDLTILKTVDFAVHRPLSICVETVGYSETLHRAKSTEIHELMFANGYVEYADTYVNTIFVDGRYFAKQTASH